MAVAEKLYFALSTTGCIMAGCSGRAILGEGFDSLDAEIVSSNLF
jgi:hypothetical protein